MYTHLVKVSSGIAPAASTSRTGSVAGRDTVDDSPATSTRIAACVTLPTTSS